MPNRRTFIRAGAALALAPLAAAVRAAPSADGYVYKSSACGCCADWVKHLERNGFTVRVIEQNDLGPIRRKLGVPGQLAACHTAIIGGYVVEGHVPAPAIRKLLAEKPEVIGVSVPGMPEGSPGMEGPKPEPFDVLAFDERGRWRVFQSFRPPYRW